MKKIIILIAVIIFVPYIIVKYFIKEEEIKFNFVSNRVVRLKRNKTNTIEEIPFEKYIVGVLSGEMPASFPSEALKAQAVAARSYVLKKMDPSKEYDVIDTISDQVYLDEETLKNKWGNDYIKNINKMKQAVLDTKGEYLTYNNEIIKAFFFSTSHGKTENCEDVFHESLPYLKSVDSNWDINVSPVFNDEKIIPLIDFYQKLGLQYTENLNIIIKSKTETGSIKIININGKDYNGTDIRFKLGLRSTYFTIEKSNKNVKIKTKGNGHGVGMSQYGAMAMANNGYNYVDILKHYYTNVEIKKL